MTPADIDLLSFDAVAETLADALLDDRLDPVALGLSGSWGSGKTTVFGLVARELDRRKTTEQKVLWFRRTPGDTTQPGIFATPSRGSLGRLSQRESDQQKVQLRLRVEVLRRMR